MTELRQAVAVHEAGHAVAAVKLGLPFHHVTVEPGDYGLARLYYGPEPFVASDLHRAQVCLAGPAAQTMLCPFEAMEEFRGWFDDAWGNDLRMARSYGVNVQRVLAEMCRKVVEWQDEIRAVAAALLAERTLTYGRVLEVLRG